MFDPTACRGDEATGPAAPAAHDPPPDLEAAIGPFAVARRVLCKRQHVFRAGQPQRALYLVHSGVFKTVLVSVDGREKITGFPMRGELLGLESIDLQRHACDAVALDTGEVWELPLGLLGRHLPQLDGQVVALLARALRSDAQRLLALCTLDADQRLADFLLDLAGRHAAQGCSAQRLLLRMTRAEIGNYLGINLETVTRSLARLSGAGLVRVQRRDIQILDAASLRALLPDAA